MAKSSKSGPPVIVKKEENGHEGGHHGGSWKVAYADFVTAMMALFLLLWLLAALKPTHKEQISLVFQDKPTQDAEMRQRTQMPIYMSKDFKQGTPEFKTAQKQKMLYEIALKVKELIAERPDVLENSGVSSDQSGVLMQVNNAIMFEPGSAVLKPSAARMLNGVVEILLTQEVSLVVRGHADDAEAASAQYPTKWELSSARAVAALRYIVEKGGIPAKRVRATGYGDSRPLVPEMTAESQAKNRRVEFFYHSPETEVW